MVAPDPGLVSLPCSVLVHRDPGVGSAGAPALDCLSQARCRDPGLGLVDLGTGVLGGRVPGDARDASESHRKALPPSRTPGCPGTPVSGVVCCGLVLTTFLPDPGFLLIRVGGPGQLGPHRRGDACGPPVSPDAPSGAHRTLVPQPPARLPPAREHSCGRAGGRAHGAVPDAVWLCTRKGTGLLRVSGSRMCSEPPTRARDIPLRP